MIIRVMEVHRRRYLFSIGRKRRTQASQVFEHFYGKQQHRSVEIVAEAKSEMSESAAGEGDRPDRIGWPSPIVLLSE